jgi:hypothetical protein
MVPKTITRDYTNNTLGERSMSNRFVSIFLLFLFLISLFSVLTPATQEAFSQNSKPSIAWWSKTYERPYADRAWSVIQTVDGGYAIVGETERSFGTGESDYWLIKTDADWNVQWNRTYGGTGRYNQSRGHRIVQTRDGGYAIVGVTDCFGVEGTDYWLVRTDENGKMQYNRTYGGPGYDRPFSLIQTTDGGYGIAGKWGAVLAESEYDMGVVKTDADGNLQWIKIYGGPNFDTGLSMLQTRDGGYAIVGETESFGAGDRDFWLVKTDVNGNMQWNRTYGGPSSEIPWSIVQTKGGGYAIGGYTRSFGAGAEDFWLVRTDVNGNMLWNKTYGGMNLDWQYSMVQTWDGG